MLKKKFRKKFTDDKKNHIKVEYIFQLLQHHLAKKGNRNIKK